MILHLYFARRFLMSFLALVGILFSLIYLVDLVDLLRDFADTDVKLGDGMGWE